MERSEATYKLMEMVRDAEITLRVQEAAWSQIVGVASECPALDWVEWHSDLILDRIGWLRRGWHELFGALALKPGASIMVGEIDPDTRRPVEHDG